MRKLLLIALSFAAFALSMAAYLFWTTPRESVGVRFPLDPSRRDLLTNIPASADSFALIPTAGVVHGKLVANPITRDAVGRWTARQRLPPPWMIGGADLMAWRSGKQISYAIRLDPLRGWLVRIYLMLAADRDARSSGGTFLINATPEGLIAPSELSALLELAQALPAGDALVVQRKGARGAFPPIGRPAATTVRVGRDEIVLTSRSAAERRAVGGESAGETGSPAHVRYPRSALITFAFSSPPRAIEDLNRLVQTRISTLLADGGAIALYDIDMGKLLPRPREVFLLPANAERREALRRFVADVAPRALREVLGFRIETEDTGSELLVAFERATIDRYLHDAFVDPRLPASSWSLRIDPARAIPMLDRLSDSSGLRYAAPRLFRLARDLSRWIGELGEARSIEAAHSVSGGSEEFRVVISSK